MYIYIKTKTALCLGALKTSKPGRGPLQNLRFERQIEALTAL